MGTDDSDFGEPGTSDGKVGCGSDMFETVPVGKAYPQQCQLVKPTEEKKTWFVNHDP